MEIYTKAEGNIKTITDKYKNGREIARVSATLEINGVKYREVKYNSIFLGRVGREVKGFLYLTEEGEVVKNLETLRELAALARSVDLFFNTPSRESFKNAIVSERNIEKEKSEYASMQRGLEFLRERGVQGTEVIVDILRKLPETRKQNNTAFEAVNSKLESLETEDMVFTPAIIKEVNPLYTEAMAANFQRVKLVSRGSKYYDEVKKQTSTIRKKTRTKVAGKETIEGLTRLEAGLGSFIKLLLVYNKILDMSLNQYMNFLKEVEKEKVDTRLKLNRA